MSLGTYFFIYAEMLKSQSGLIIFSLEEKACEKTDEKRQQKIRDEPDNSNWTILFWG